MEVVTMAHRVLFRNSIIIWLASVGLFGCNSSMLDSPATHSIVLLNKDEQRISIANGLLIINKQPFSGRLFSLFPSTRDTVEIASYREGREHGEWVKFYPSGKIKEKRFFDDGQKIGEYLAWWENGNRQLHYFFEADEYEGTCKEWNIDGKLVKVFNYKKGHEEGHQQWWYDNGRVKANYVIQDGRRFGLLGTKNCVNVSDSIFGK
jgi:antitoxin component YwqK of YwqJK toxin-antitoxin module